MCRAAAKELSDRRNDFAAKGVKLVAISSVDMGAEEFRSAVWPNDAIYVDDENAFKMALGGQQYKNSWLCSFSVIRKIFRTKYLGMKSDDISDKTSYLGGTLVVRDSEVLFRKTEDSSFSYAEPDEVLAAM
eukprot:TRINITY_DN24585_c0_g1_i1.p1 TRINITY_DN24585_c0_g1~~TRINITY_DN24585_c0_g1_i1.p1  ORF type:complete len:131 (-),score=20.51 TRINITY_DN24585_c0_g1_i1:119-511(-)